MINRRHIRLKVMQSVYAMTQSQSSDLLKEEKFLKHSAKRMFDLYALSLQLMVEVQKLAREKIEISKKKILPTKEDLQPNTKFINNILLIKLTESESLQQYIETYNLQDWVDNDEYVKIIYEELISSKLYKTYIEMPNNSFGADKDFVIEFFREIIAPNEKLAEYYEDSSISWVDDIPFVNTWIIRVLNKQSAKNEFFLGSLYKNVEDEEFVSQLLKKVMLHHHKFDEVIKNNTPNWETDRIADIDLILIKMGIVEFVEFPSVPVRVTINEYIELAKDYSTQKSSYFINGILDKVSRQFLDEKRIVKVGRGLL